MIRIIIDRDPAKKYIVHHPATFINGRPDYRSQGFADQSAAEYYAAGVAAGLRACGRSCEVVIDVPEDDASADDLLDMGALDAWAQRAGGHAGEAAEVDPVERRLAREAEAGRFIASATGVG